MADKTRKIILTLEGEKLSYTTDVSPALAAKIMSICLSDSGHEGVSGGESTRSTDSLSSITASPGTSPAEFLNIYGPRRNPDKILALAVYLQKHEGRNRFNPGEIKRLFRDAGEVVPANFTRDFRWVISSGWVHHDPYEKENYYVTSTGHKVVEKGFPDDMIKKSAQSKALGSRRKKKGKKSAAK